MDKIRVGAVNYRNAKPLVFGLQQPEMTKIIELSFDYPARLVDQLNRGQIDIGLVPVASIPKIQDAQVIGDYGIATDGKVASVALFSHVPIEEIQSVILDYQSRTSAALLRILMNDFWKKEVAFLPSISDEYIDEINGATAGLIIGDRALQNLGRFPFVYDLGEAWKMLTGMPFVFAVWVASKPMDRTFIEQFDAANSVGLLRLDELANAWPLPGVDMLAYYRDRISYRIDMQKRNALEGFLESIG